jgi:hypothetical protein
LRTPRTTLGIVSGIEALGNPLGTAAEREQAKHNYYLADP